MLNVAFSLRYIMFVASLGAAMGALVMLWEGCVKLFGALRVSARPATKGRARSSAS